MVYGKRALETDTNLNQSVASGCEALSGTSPASFTRKPHYSSPKPERRASGPSGPRPLNQLIEGDFREKRVGGFYLTVRTTWPTGLCPSLRPSRRWHRRRDS